MIPGWKRVTAGAAVYLAMVGRLDSWTLAQAVAVATAAALLAGRQPPSRQPPTRAGWRFARRAVRVAVRQILAGSWRVGSSALGLARPPRSGTIEVAYGEQPDVDPTRAALLETLSPGTYLLDADFERGVLVYHLFDEADAAALRWRHRELLGASGRAGGRRP